jgi:hypothetical protein
MLLSLVAAGCGRIDFDDVRATPRDATAADASQIDTAASCAPVTCTGAAMATMCNGRCITACADLVSWVAGDSLCTSWGGRPASIRDQLDQDCLVSILTTASWLGYRQTAAQASPAAGWAWVDGTTIGYLKWGANEPMDGDGVEDDTEQCAQISGSGDWADQVCAVTRAITCSK